VGCAALQDALARGASHRLSRGSSVVAGGRCGAAWAVGATRAPQRASLDTSASEEGRRSSRALVCCHANTSCFICFVFPCQSLPPPIACRRMSSFHVSPTAPSCTGDEMRIGGSAEERRSGRRARLRLPCPCLFVWTDLSRSPMTTAQTRLSLWQRCATRR
jgi:hypothetical protein